MFYFASTTKKRKEQMMLFYFPEKFKNLNDGDIHCPTEVNAYQRKNVSFTCIVNRFDPEVKINWWWHKKRNEKSPLYNGKLLLVNNFLLFIIFILNFLVFKHEKSATYSIDYLTCYDHGYFTFKATLKQIYVERSIYLNVTGCHGMPC